MKEMIDLIDFYGFLQQEQKVKHEEFLNNVEENKAVTKYSDNVLVEFFPFENEIFGLKKGKELSLPKEITKDVKRNVFDHSGSLIMTEDVLAGDRVTSRSFYFYHNDYSERISFQKVGTFRLKTVSRFFNKHENLILLIKSSIGEGQWDFKFEGNILNHIIINERDCATDFSTTRVVELKYNESHKLIEVINKYENGSSQIIYKVK